MDYSEIDKRYSGLAESNCCLSCGGTINYSEASEGEICVDLGSWRGTDVLRLAESVGNHGFIYGIDISEGMLQKEKIQLTGLVLQMLNLSAALLKRSILPIVLLTL